MQTLKISGFLRSHLVLEDKSTQLQGVPTLSEKSNFDVTARKFGQIFKVKVFSCSQMKNNSF